MSNLSNQQINQSFNGLLQIPGGITSTLQTVQDGNGNPTGLQLSSAGANVTTSNTFVASKDGIAITGIVPRLISDGFGDYLSVKDFGAVGDGVTDDTATIQAAIDAGQNKNLYFPSGIYLCSDLSVPHSITFIGESNSSLVHKANSATSLIHVFGTSVKFSSFGMTYDGNYSAQINQTYTIKHNPIGTSADASELSLQNNYFKNGNYADVYVSTDAVFPTIDLIKIANNTFIGGKEGSAVSDARYISITSPCNLNISGNYIDFASTPSSYGRAGIISWISGYSGVSSRGFIGNNIIRNTGRSSAAILGTLGAIDIYAGGGNLVIDGNTIVNPYGRGIQLKSDASNVVISNNTIDALLDLTGGVAVDAQITVNRSVTTSVNGNVSIIGNVCKYSSHDAISVSEANTDYSNFASPISIASNSIINASRIGIGMYYIGAAICSGNIIDAGCSSYGIHALNNNTNSQLLIDGNNLNSIDGNAINIRTIQYVSCANNVSAGCNGYDISIGYVTSGKVCNNHLLSSTPFEYAGATISDYAGIIFESNKCLSSISAGTYRVTITSGNASVICDFLELNTENNAATDDLTNLNNGYEGCTVVLKAYSASRVVTVKNGTGNLFLSADYVLDNTHKTISLKRIGSSWYEISRSANT